MKALVVVPGRPFKKRTQAERDPTGLSEKKCIPGLLEKISHREAHGEHRVCKANHSGHLGVHMEMLHTCKGRKKGKTQN